MSELKPCPFCGDTERDGAVHEQDIYYSELDLLKYGIMCESCGAEISEFNTVGQAIEAWNKRVKSVDCSTAEKCADGKCMGYGFSDDDDEPIDQCKECKKYQSYGIE